MARNQSPIMLIYPEDKEFLRDSTMNYQNIETGGDLFGLWQNESEVVVQLVSGPGKYCRRTPTAFYQDPTYLSNVGGYLTSAKGLCNIGEWHSHHRLNLSEPSGGDKATVWRNMPGCGLKRFLLIIATITRTGQVEMNGFMFAAPENGASYGGMQRVQTRVLTGPNPFRTQPDVLAKLHEGVEGPGPSEYIRPTSDSSELTDATYIQREFKKNKSETQDKASEPTEKSKKTGFGQIAGRMFGKHKGESGYEQLPDYGGTSGYYSTSNVVETHARDHTTPQHVPTRNEDGQARSPSSPGHHTTTQTPSYKVVYQKSSNV